MENDKRLDVIEARNYKVVKDNEIIRKARYDLGLAEIKAFSFILSKVKPTDGAFAKYTFTINEYCKVLGIETNNGRNIQNVKKSLKALKDKSFWLIRGDGKETTVGWLAKATIDHGSGKIEVRLDEDLLRYVTGLYSNYTQYELLCTLPMRSTYSIRIFELLKSYAYQQQHEFNLEQLKKALCCEHYERFPDFRRKVLEKAVKEINQYTDIEVTWRPITKGKKVIGLDFQIKQRDTWDKLLASQRAQSQLDGQMSIYDWLQPEQNL